MKTSHRILVINPNSTQAVTDGLDAAVAGFRTGGHVIVDCITLDQGPPGIESQRDADSVIAPLVARVRQHEAGYDAFVIACYSDPGIHSVREVTRKPVLGIAECGLMTAMTIGHRIGVIAILRKSIARHLRHAAGMGIAGRIVAELPLEMGVTELGDESRTIARLVEVGRALREQHGADVLVLGCAGMAAYRERVEQQVGIPVVDPAQAAVAMAIGRAMLA